MDFCGIYWLNNVPKKEILGIWIGIVLLDASAVAGTEVGRCSHCRQSLSCWLLFCLRDSEPVVSSNHWILDLSQRKPENHFSWRVTRKGYFLTLWRDNQQGPTWYKLILVDTSWESTWHSESWLSWHWTVLPWRPTGSGALGTDTLRINDGHFLGKNRCQSPAD